MNWKQYYGFRSYLRSSLWVVPFIAIPIELLATRLLHWLDGALGWKLLGLAVPGAQALLQATVTSTLSFVVFTFGSMLVAIQVASAQMTPRIIATTLLRNDVVRYTVGLFIFTLMFALSAQNRMEKDVYQLVVFTAGLLCLACFAAFFYLIDYASRLLRPISVLTHVGDGGIAVVESVYPNPSLGPEASDSASENLGVPDCTIRHLGKSGIVLAVNFALLSAEAEKSDNIVELVPLVGDFIAVDDPLFNLYGGGRSVSEQTLRSAVAFGSERTMEQDPTFAFRIVVDIALRALSPAINDPTTGVLSIDQLHRMLRVVGKRNLGGGEMLDSSKQRRVVFRTPNWEDFVHLSFSEIRACGSNNLQIVRRLRAMMENLIKTLPEHRHAALNQQRSMLDRDIEKHFTYPDELALAFVADSQGLGGHSIKGKNTLGPR